MPGVALNEVTAAANPAVDLDDLRAMLRIDDHDHDRELAIRRNAAIEYLQTMTGQQFVNATFDEYWDCFTDEQPLIVSRLPLSSVTSVKYYDTDGAEQTLSSATYTVDTHSRPGRIYLTYGQSWPGVRVMLKAVTVRYVAGYGADESSVPDDIKQHIIAMAGFWYEHPENFSERRIEPGIHDRGLWAHRFQEFF